MTVITGTNWLLLFACLGVAFLVQHKIAPSLNPEEDSLLERLLGCSFCIGFWSGLFPGLATHWSLPMGEGLLLAVGHGFAVAVLYFYAETWANGAEYKRLRDEEQIKLLRRQQALADRELAD